MLRKNTFAFDATSLVRHTLYTCEKVISPCYVCTRRFHITTFARFSVFHKGIMRLGETETLSPLGEKNKIKNRYGKKYVSG